MVKIKPYELMPRKGDEENKDDFEDMVENKEKNGEDSKEGELVEDIDNKEPKNILKNKNPKIYPKI